MQKNCFFCLCIFVKAFGSVYSFTSDSDTPEYREVCRQAVTDETFFAHFKRAPEYTQILEHLGPDTGRAYLNIIRQQTPEFFNYLEAFRKNDLVGNPRKDNYPETGPISTTTIRYMKVASDLKGMFGSLEGKSIVEIGGGYGGQCLILSALHNWKSYTIIDLPEPVELAKKYLQLHNVQNVQFKTYDEALEDKSYDLVISNYAYSECTAEMRKKYIDHVLRYCKGGYVTGNGFEEELQESLRSYGICCEQLMENPLTRPGNVLVLWNSASAKDKTMNQTGYTPEKILPDGEDSTIAINPFTGDKGEVRKGTVAATLNNIALLNKLLLDGTKEKEVHSIKESIIALLPSLKIVGIFHLFSLEEWVNDYQSPGRIYVALLYLQKYPHEITQTLATKLRKIKQNVNSPYLCVEINSIEKIIPSFDL